VNPRVDHPRWSQATERRIGEDERRKTLAFNGYAEQVAVPAGNCMPYPENLRWEEAAAIPLVFLTAWHMLVGRADLQPGEDCLVVGAGSGVGSAAIQIARLIGARVIATAGSAAKLERASALGAHEAVDHSRGDFAAEVRALTAKKGVEVAVEHVGGRVFEQAAAAFDNPDFVPVVIHSYRHRHLNAPGEPRFDEVERRLAARPRIEVPSAILHGRDDGVDPPRRSETHPAMFPDGTERHVVPDAGHFLPREQPGAVVDALLPLLARTAR